MEITEHGLTGLDEYARVSIAFEVRSVLDVSLREGGLAGMELTERPVASPFVKDYDAIAGNRPGDWAARFDVSRWALLAARDENHLVVGGLIIAFDTPGLDMLEGRRDLAVIWDMRVAPHARRRGVGSALFAAAERSAISRGCRQLKIETQNINVPACRFYARRGCTLGAIHRFAYPELPGEVQLLWYKDIAPSATPPLAQLDRVS